MKSDAFQFTEFSGKCNTPEKFRRRVGCVVYGRDSLSTESDRVSFDSFDGLFLSEHFHEFPMVGNSADFRSLRNDRKISGGKVCQVAERRRRFRSEK